ncbi:MAG: response regulator transcription factor [Oscillospiraceae bacterium]|jgi:DNA-binding response OmpR family regulator|nr:response regulator transcription factor [Oscillospiraceae bacterium]
MAQHILLVEDETKLARVLELELGYEGYEVTKAADGREGLTLALAGSFDLILLDIMLPLLSGIEVLRRLRKSSSVPVIMLTARDSVTDKVSGLDYGADDYVTKPFEIEELLARIRVALRHGQSGTENEVLECGALKMDMPRREVTVNGTAVGLTKREFDLLGYLLKNKGIVVTREQLLEHVWDIGFDGGTNTVDVYIRFLRGKIDDAFGIKLISTVRGVGYVIKDTADNER